MVKVKICGITNKRDARMAINSGADAIGVIVNVQEETPRKIDIKQAKEIFKEIPIFISSIVVLIPSSLKEVEMIVRELNPDVIQLQGNESIDFVSELKRRIRKKVIKTIHVEDGSSNVLKEAKKFSSIVDAILLDTKVDGKSGGTGKTHDWGISAKVKEVMGETPLILSGGLNPKNIEMAIRKVKPYAVDVSSGVELKPRRKDEEKVKAFIKKCTK